MRYRRQARLQKVVAGLLALAGLALFGAFMWPDAGGERHARTEPAPLRTLIRHVEAPPAFEQRLTRARVAGLTLSQRVRGAIPATAAVAAGGGREDLVALTFDGGPSPYTAPLLDVLAAYRAQATFFVVGRKIDANRALLRRVRREGHAIGNGTWAAPHLRQMRASDARLQVTGADEALRDAGVRTMLMRPPAGETSARLNRAQRALGLVPVVWSIDADDGGGLRAAQIAQRVLGRVRPGDIVRLHDGGRGERAATVRALPLILAGPGAQGVAPGHGDGAARGRSSHRRAVAAAAVKSL